MKKYWIQHSQEPRHTLIEYNDICRKNTILLIFNGNTCPHNILTQIKSEPFNIELYRNNKLSFMSVLHAVLYRSSDCDDTLACLHARMGF